MLVIGGGITGAGIARDAAMRGLSTALVEREDFASGTSSKSTKLIHGGHRYLTTYDFGLVYESCRERYLLGRIAPRLWRPIPIIYPFYQASRLGMLYRATGMWMYDALALFRNVQRHRMLKPAETRQLEPALRKEALSGAALYYDCQTNDAWLALATIRSAHRYGAVIANYCPVTAFRDHGEPRECVVRDATTGEERGVRARTIVNAAGPWLDEVRGLAGPGRDPTLMPSKGAHLIIPRERLGHERSVIFDSEEDGRTLVAISAGRLTILGATEQPPGPDWDVTARSEVDYLLRIANRVFPDAKLTPADVWCAFSGVRPLLRTDRGSLTAASRTHKIIEESDGLISIGGGKLTTYRFMAEQVVDTVARRLGKRSGPCLTAEIPLDGPDAVPGDESTSEEGSELAAHLRRRYGPAAEELEEMLHGDPSLAAPIAAGLPYVLAEVPYGVRNEMALTIEDLMARRVPVLYEDQDHGLAALQAIAALMAAELGWDEQKKGEQMALYRTRVERSSPLSAASREAEPIASGP